MLSIIKKFIPKPIFSLYHKFLAVTANLVYKSPSDKMIVIGVTGTSGKSTTVYMIAKLLEEAGFRVGAASTILFKVGKKEWINDKKMTMIGRFGLQNLLSQMQKANCQYAVIETTSQGIEQFRHLKINYDILVFTNLYPEHIEAHGGFENYKNAKLKLFKILKTLPKKIINGQRISKTIIANLDDEHVNDFLNNWAEEKYVFTTKNNSTDKARIIRALDIVDGGLFSEFKIDQVNFKLNIAGLHNVYNALAAISIARTQGLSIEKISESLTKVKGIPGRLEFIDEGQDYSVIVDYAFEPKAMSKLYDVVNKMNHNKVIHVLGGTGGGRDISRRPILGKIAGELSDFVVVTNEDPYDEDPQDIIDQVAEGALGARKVLDKDLFKIEDRRQAIKKAISLAGKDDIILVTGKGSEQAIVVKNNKMIDWDDRKVVREEIKNSKQ